MTEEQRYATRMLEHLCRDMNLTRDEILVVAALSVEEADKFVADKAGSDDPAAIARVRKQWVKLLLWFAVEQGHLTYNMKTRRFAPVVNGIQTL